MTTDLTVLDPRATLARVERRLRARRAGEVTDITLAVHWAGLNAADPQAEPGAVPVSRGGDRLITIGGDGTPAVAELAIAEYAIARNAGVVATENYLADCLDLVHRLPGLWAAVQRLELDAWVALKVARMSRNLTKERVGIVDAAVTAVRRGSPARLLAVAEAKIIEADPDAHRAKLAADAQRTGVWLSKVKPGEIVEATGEPATRRVTTKLRSGAAIRCAENVEDLAHALLDHTHSDTDAEGSVPTLADARLQAFELLTTDPHAASAFLDALDTAHSDPADPDPEPAPAPVEKPKRSRRPATLVVHLSESVLSGHTPGVVRVEDLGPVLLEELHDLLGPDRQIIVQPVIDLHTIESVNGYEHPTRIARRTLLRTGGDVFPHSTSRGTKRLDIDHPTPYDPNGPPGQTGDRNAAPLTRRHHRAKTHRPYQVTQLALGAYRWISPHGLCRLVTPQGTRTFEPIRVSTGSTTKPGAVIGEIYDGPGVAFDYPGDDRRTGERSPPGPS
jgi:hypothetical protein